MAKDIRWLTIADAAEIACCDQKTIRHAVWSGRLRAAHRGGRRRELKFLEKWLEEWLANQLLPPNHDTDLPIHAASLRREIAMW